MQDIARLVNTIFEQQLTMLINIVSRIKKKIFKHSANYIYDVQLITDRQINISNC